MRQGGGGARGELRRGKAGARRTVMLRCSLRQQAAKICRVVRCSSLADILWQRQPTWGRGGEGRRRRWLTRVGERRGERKEGVLTCGAHRHISAMSAKPPCKPAKG